MPRRWTQIVMAFMTALALVPLGKQPSLEAQAPTDARQRVVLSAPARDKILAEMRAMLQSLSGVLHALAANDLAGAEQAAHASGMGMAVDVQPEIRMQLPPAFLQLGMQTHRSFDALADQLKGGGARETVLKSLASLTSNCVGCHAGYRLDEAR